MHHGSADHPTKELLEISDALQLGRGMNPSWLTGELPTVVQSPPHSLAVGCGLNKWGLESLVSPAAAGEGRV